MDHKYTIRTLKLKSGERHPYLIDKKGMPMEYPTLYSICELRARRLTSNTINQNRQSIMVLYLYCELEKIDLASRLKEGKLFTIYELDGLTRTCHYAISEIEAQIKDKSKKPSKIVNLVIYKKSNRSPQTVNLKSVGVRLINIKKYLGWLVIVYSASIETPPNVSTLLSQTAFNTLKQLEGRIPVNRSTNTPSVLREGITHEEEAELLNTVHPSSANNPWQSEFSKIRNYIFENKLSNTKFSYKSMQRPNSHTKLNSYLYFGYAKLCG